MQKIFNEIIARECVWVYKEDQINRCDVICNKEIKKQQLKDEKRIPEKEVKTQVQEI